MPKKPINRKRQQGKRRARAHRAQRRQPAAAPAPDRDRLAAELHEILLAALRNGELGADVEDLEDLEDEDEDWADAYDEDDVPRDFEPEAQRIVFDTVDEILATRDARPASDIERRLTEGERRAVFDLCPGDGPLIGEAAAVHVLLGLRFGPGRPDASAAVRWVAHHLGAEAARQALRVADLLDHPDAPPWHQVHPPPDGDASLLPSLVLLLTGVAAGVDDNSAE